MSKITSSDQTDKLNLSYLEGTVGYSIRRAQIAVFRDIFACFDDKSITLVQFSVLAVLEDNPEITQTELAEALAVERPRIVPIINALEERGLAKRTIREDDKRNRRLMLTPRGQALLKQLKERFAKHERRLVEVLGGTTSKLLLTLHALTRLGH
ncbi:MAG: MarR family winged helix-turn-helix transcriptional regulator [Burkholderiales bacterium]